MAALSTLGNPAEVFGKISGQTTSSPKRVLGKTGFEVFPVVYGGVVSMRDGQEASDRYVSWAIDRGINYFDVAPSYDDAEEKLGISLKPYRKDIYLACKTQERLRTAAEQEFERSFKLLHTDYFDLYQLHAMTTQEDIDKAFGPGGVMEMIVKAKEEGRIRKVGFTAHNEAVGLQTMSLYDFDTVMYPVNWMMNRYNGMATDICREAKQRNMGIISIKSLTHRHWKDDAERQQSGFPKSWCKPVDTDQDKALGMATVRFSLGMGSDILIPPGNFKSFTFFVDHINELLSHSLTAEETALLDKEYAEVREYPFFG